MRNKKNLQNAIKARNYEFYTLEQDIEKEIKHYENDLKGKVVYCNCDNIKFSAFWGFFKKNYKRLKLKGLIATWLTTEGQAYKAEFRGKRVQKTKIYGNGSFDSHDCKSILMHEKNLVVISNPPFTYFKEYVNLLMEFNCKFLVLGNLNAVFYKPVRPLYVNDQVWLGVNKGSMRFLVPDNYEGKHKLIKGKKYATLGNVRWFTNLKKHEVEEDFILIESYRPNKYAKYDNYDAIEVPTSKSIPKDYDGVMGVPISFVDKFNPKQFDKIGFSRDIEKTDGKQDLKVDGEIKFGRLMIQRKVA